MHTHTLIQVICIIRFYKAKMLVYSECVRYNIYILYINNNSKPQNEPECPWRVYIFSIITIVSNITYWYSDSDTQSDRHMVTGKLTRALAHMRVHTHSQMYSVV